MEWLRNRSTRLWRVLWRLWNYLLPLVTTLNSNARRIVSRCGSRWLLNSLNPLRRSFALRRLHLLSPSVTRLCSYGALLCSRLPSGFHLLGTFLLLLKALYLSLCVLITCR
jgi:hypothetical protein